MKKVLALLMALAMLFALCGCSGNFFAGRKDGFARETAADMEYVPSPVMVNSYDAAAVAEESYGGFAVNGAFAASGVSSKNAENIDLEKIIYSADATVETTEFDKTIAALEQLIEKLGGWTESGSVSGTGYDALSRGKQASRNANYTIRVPNEKFEELMGELSSLGNVPYSHIYTENVTAEYYDTKARLTTYEAQEKRLLELLDQAETVSDVIEIENELTEVRYRIESLQTSLRGWDRRVNWSTLYLAVNEVREYTPQEQRSYADKLKASVKDGIEELGEFFLDFVEALPILILLLVALIIVILIIKKAVRSGNGKQKEKKEEKIEETKPKEE